MKLSREDEKRLLAMRSSAEDPSRWRLDSDYLERALGKERLREVVKSATTNDDGNKVLSLTSDEARRVSEALGAKGERGSLSNGVFVIHEINGVPDKNGTISAFKRHASISANNGVEVVSISKAYVMDVVRVLGFSDASTFDESPGHVWHVYDGYAFDADDDVIGKPVPLESHEQRSSEKAPSAAEFKEKLCSIGRALFENMERLEASKAAFSTLDNIEAEGSAPNLRIRGVPKGHAAHPFVMALERWLNHGPACPMCRKEVV